MTKKKVSPYLKREIEKEVKKEIESLGEELSGQIQPLARNISRLLREYTQFSRQLSRQLSDIHQQLSGQQSPQGGRKVTHSVPTTPAPQPIQQQLEAILDKYRLPQWTREMYESPFSDIYHRVWGYYDEIKSNYRPLLKNIIELARTKNMDPREYAAFIMASLDEKFLKVEVPDLQLSETELRIVDML